jgi:hypothetical protein
MADSENLASEGRAVPPAHSGLSLQYGDTPLRAPFAVPPAESAPPQSIDDAIAEHEAAAGCPEDMGCAEYISVLIKQRDEARAALVADMRTRGWYAFCREHQQKVDDRCPRCELEALRAAHAPLEPKNYEKILARGDETS